MRSHLHEEEARQRAIRMMDDIYSEPKELLIKKVKDAIISVVKCRRLYLFGSYVWGKFTDESDLDFFIVLFNQEKESFEALKYKIIDELAERDIWFPVDFIMELETEFSLKAKSSMPTLEKKVFSEGIILFENPQT